MLRRLAPPLSALAAAVVATKFDGRSPAPISKQVPFGGDDDAFRRGHRVPFIVVAIGVVHVPLPEPPHGFAALGGDGGVVLLHQRHDHAAAVARLQLVDRVDDASF